MQAQINNKTKKFLVLEDFKDDYVQAFKKLRATFSDMLKSSRIVADKSLSGVSIADFVPEVVKAINALEEGGQLHVPNIWEEAQNEAINKASIKFRHDFKDACDKLNNESKICTSRECSEASALLPRASFIKSNNNVSRSSTKPFKAA